MIKWIFIAIMLLIGLMDFALAVACSRAENRETYEAYERWKESRKDE